jgi:hypothetical protein
MKKRKKTNLIHRGGGGRRSHHKKKITVHRTKGIKASYKDRVEHSVKTINTERWKLASKGQSQFRKLQIKFKLCPKMDGNDEVQT